MTRRTMMRRMNNRCRYFYGAGSFSSTQRRLCFLVNSSLTGCCFFYFNPQPLLYAMANVVISEIADKGTADACNGNNDWVELYNNGSDAVDLAGWILHDDKGPDDEEAFTFGSSSGSSTVIVAGEFLLLCMELEDDVNSLSPQFGIGDTDTITLLDTTTMSNTSSSGSTPEIIASQVQLTGGNTDATLNVMTYALDEADGSYKYTTTSTPGLPNVITTRVENSSSSTSTNTSTTTTTSTTATLQERLTAQNAEGTRFFNMDDHGLPVVDGMDAMVDLHITMDEDAYQDLMQNATYQLYVPFNSARVVVTKKTTLSNENSDVAVQQQQQQVEEEQEVILNLTRPGRIRTKGQFTLVFGVCMDTPTLPFQLDFNTDDDDDSTHNKQTLFGVERLYLRNHMADFSFLREWTSHRMLARFGLPHLRSRTVRFFINNNKIGLYTLLEAVDQDYVFHRSFPTVDFDNYALYKVKTMSRDCGRYDAEEIAAGQVRLGNDTSTPPYSFDNGDHREKIPVLGFAGMAACFQFFYENVMNRESDDVLLAYLRYNQDCGTMMVEERIVDRDLGKKEPYDAVMAQFINDHLAGNQCDEHCQNSNLANEVNIENFLKNFAVYAVALIQDSPMGNGNNYYLANPGDGMGWNLVSYDHNMAGDSTCSADICDSKFIHWSIVRPTCKSLESNQIVGPLLTNATLLAKYIDYVRIFVDEVIGNASFIEQIQHHGQAIKNEVALDYWSEGGAYFDVNLSLDPTLWNKDQMSPLLPLYVARVADVREQLDALERGTFPRGNPFSGDTTQGVDPEARCVDWHSTGCPDNCVYEGCDRPDWAISSYCMIEYDRCYHGDVDYMCNGVSNWDQYNGMENREDGSATFCHDFGDGSGPIKMSACPFKLLDNEEATIPPPAPAPVAFTNHPAVLQEETPQSPIAIPTTGINSQQPPVVRHNDPLEENNDDMGTTNVSTPSDDGASIRDQSVTSSASSERQYAYRPSFQLVVVVLITALGHWTLTRC